MSNQYTFQDLKDNLDYLAETKSLLKTALINKGQDVSDDDTFRSYVDKLNNISTSENLETELSELENVAEYQANLATNLLNRINNLNINGSETSNEYIISNEFINMSLRMMFSDLANNSDINFIDDYLFLNGIISSDNYINTVGEFTKALNSDNDLIYLKLSNIDPTWSYSYISSSDLYMPLSVSKSDNMYMLLCTIDANLSYSNTSDIIDILIFLYIDEYDNLNNQISILLCKN